MQAALAPDHQVPFLLMLLHNPAAVPAINGTADGMLHSPAGQAGNLTEAIAPPLHNASGQGYNFSTASGPGGNATGAGSARASGAQITLLAAWLGRIVEQVEVHFEGPNLLDWVCLVVGYCIVAGLLLLGLWAFLTWKVCPPCPQLPFDWSFSACKVSFFYKKDSFSACETGKKKKIVICS